MKLAIQTSRLPGADLNEQFAAAARYGFDAVEVTVGPAFDLAERLDDARRASETSGLPVCAICTHSMHDPLVPDPAERERRFAGLAALLAMADILGAGGVVSVPVRPPHAFPAMVDRDRELFDLAVAEFGRWAAKLPAGRSAVFLEPLNRYEAFFLRRVEQAVALAERVDHPRVMALGDLFHMNIEESHQGEPLQRAGKHLGHVHLADNNRLEPGQGCLDFRTPFAALKALDYQGYLAIESGLSGDPATALPATVHFLRDRWDRAYRGTDDMPHELIAVAPRQPVLREYAEPVLGEREVRIRTEFASPKHGTELVAYRDEPAANRPYDASLGAMMPISDEAKGRRFPRRLGNMAVGVVTETGAGVTRFNLGDRVFGHLPIRETHTVDETAVDPIPERLSDEAAVCLDPVVMALAMRDAGIKLGDHVAVFGMGAIGLIAIQLARQAGAHTVIAVDPIAHRREVALALGADAAIDPIAADDTGLTIRRLTGWHGSANTPPSPERRRVRGGYWEAVTQTGQLGVDVAVEVSGSSRALHDAIRATRFGGAICVLSFYGREATGLHLGEEFHVNQLRLISARAESLPLRDAPAWNLARLVDVSLAWLASGRLRTEGIVWPIVPFSDSAEAYRAIDEHPEQSIKLGIRFG